MLADLVRTDSHQLRTFARDSKQAGATKVLTRMHQSLIWDRTRQVLRLRSALREFFPAALEAYEDLAFPDVLELLTKAPEPHSAARLTRAQITAALRRAGRRDREAKTTAIMASLAVEHLTQPPLIAAAYGATVRALAALATANLGGRADEDRPSALGRPPWRGRALPRGGCRRDSWSLPSSAD